jgi:hypothetical protein
LEQALVLAPTDCVLQFNLALTQVNYIIGDVR